MWFKCQIPFEHTFDGGQKIGNLDKASGPCFATLRHLADRRTNETDAVGLELRDVPACRRIEPHGGVHCGRDENGLVGGKQNGRREIVGVAARHPRDKIGSRRCDDDEIVIASQPDVSDLAFLIKVEEIGQHPLIGQRTDGKRSDEVVRSLRHHGPDAVAALLEAPDQARGIYRPRCRRR